MNIQKLCVSRPSSGCWYAVPTKEGEWKILSLRDDEMTVDHDHEDLWRKYVSYYLRKEFKLTEDKMAVLMSCHLGLPRGRVVEPNPESQIWTIEYDPDLLEGLRSNIMSDFGLSLEHKVRWIVKGKEEMSSEEKKTVSKILGLKE